LDPLRSGLPDLPRLFVSLFRADRHLTWCDQQAHKN
jgi:hypothetical protein